ncbi:MAG TPA: C4-type zinc ribbon domain-containing protein [Thermodesulfobacteriota bacterium]|nr:C4-type zinc ribbon domain-containing protein [Thermodesulfobacteriota bacterium]
MKEQITALEALQYIDLEMRELKDKLDKYPQEISRHNREVENVKKSIAEAKKELEQTRKNKSDFDRKLAENQESIKKAEKKLFEIKTYKEYEALQKEIGEAKRVNGEIEEEILKSMEEIDRLEKLLEEKELELTEREKEYEQVASDYKQKIEALESNYTTKKREREKVISLVNSDILSMYERIKRKNGIALVEAKNEVCTGCHMNIPPQLFNEVLTSSRIIQCPNCQRILYSEEKTNGRLQTA